MFLVDLRMAVKWEYKKSRVKVAHSHGYYSTPSQLNGGLDSRWFFKGSGKDQSH